MTLIKIVKYFPNLTTLTKNAKPMDYWENRITHVLRHLDGLIGQNYSAMISINTFHHQSWNGLKSRKRKEK